MIGVDTNVLVRVALGDDPVQSASATSLLKKYVQARKLFVASYAILEMAWVLKGKGRTRHQICEAIYNLLDSPGVMVGQRDVILNAVEKYRTGKADFGDYLILSEGEASGAKRLASFDRVLCENTPNCSSPEEFF